MGLCGNFARKLKLSWLIFCDLSVLHLGHVQQKIAQRATYEVEVMMIAHKIETVRFEDENDYEYEI